MKNKIQHAVDSILLVAKERGKLVNVPVEDLRNDMETQLLQYIGVAFLKQIQDDADKESLQNLLSESVALNSLEGFDQFIRQYIKNPDEFLEKTIVEYVQQILENL